jgi:hypothetical protein
MGEVNGRFRHEHRKAGTGFKNKAACRAERLLPKKYGKEPPPGLYLSPGLLSFDPINLRLDWEKEAKEDLEREFANKFGEFVAKNRDFNSPEWSAAQRDLRQLKEQINPEWIQNWTKGLKVFLAIDSVFVGGGAVEKAVEHVTGKAIAGVIAGAVLQAMGDVGGTPLTARSDIAGTVDNLIKNIDEAAKAQAQTKRSEVPATRPGGIGPIPSLTPPLGSPPPPQQAATASERAKKEITERITALRNLRDKIKKNQDTLQQKTDNATNLSKALKDLIKKLPEDIVMFSPSLQPRGVAFPPPDRRVLKSGDFSGLGHYCVNMRPHLERLEENAVTTQKNALIITERFNTELKPPNSRAETQTASRGMQQLQPHLKTWKTSANDVKTIATGFVEGMQGLQTAEARRKRLNDEVIGGYEKTIGDLPKLVAQIDKDRNLFVLDKKNIRDTINVGQAAAADPEKVIFSTLLKELDEIVVPPEAKQSTKPDNSQDGHRELVAEARSSVQGAFKLVDNESAHCEQFKGPDATKDVIQRANKARDTMVTALDSIMQAHSSRDAKLDAWIKKANSIFYVEGPKKIQDAQNAGDKQAEEKLKKQLETLKEYVKAGEDERQDLRNMGPTIKEIRSVADEIRQLRFDK